VAREVDQKRRKRDEESERERFEAGLRARHAAGDVRGVAADALEAYGPEVHGWLCAILRDRDAADDVYGMLALDVVKDLPQFEWLCSLRGWIYTLGRHRMLAWRRASRRRPERNVTLDEARAAEVVRTETAPWKRTSVKERMRALREQLDPDDQTLLILRVDRDLPWRDVAHVMNEREATLRKRFERVKVRLRELAQAELSSP
jgi:RNA polymerase sigma-70 factor (ECF subfamily)